MGELILAKAGELFFSYGLKSVSMDDVAKLAGISKKTLYQHFADKNELVDKIVDGLVRCHHQLFLKCQREAKDAINEVLQQSQAPFDTWASVNPGFFYELEKFFPQSWKKLEQHEENVLFPGILKNLQRGIAENYYRGDIEGTFTAEIRMNQLKNALQPNVFTKRRISVGQLINKLTIFYLHGITTEKGKALLCNYLMNTDKNETSE